MNKKHFILLLLIILTIFTVNGCSTQKEQTTECQIDTDCSPCGDQCTQTRMLPMIYCPEPTHNDCVCTDGMCVKE